MLFYFTGTGNSLYIARRIAERLGDRVLNIASEIDGECRYELGDDERLGIVCPVYFYGLPTIVEEFISKLKVNGKHFTYLALDYGGYPAQAFERAERCLSEAGFTLDGRLGVLMPENYVMMFEPPTVSEARKTIDSASIKIDEFCDALLKGGNVDHTEKVKFSHKVVGAVARPMYTHGRGTGKFYTTGNCTGCGKCASICPSKAIEMVDRIPTWKKSKCIRCNACLNRCPSKALEFGRGTEKRGRYVNPDVEFEN